MLLLELLRLMIRGRSSTHSNHLPDMMLPDLLPSLHGEILIPNTHMYAALERLVKGRDAVRRQEENPLVVFREAKEDRH